MPEAVSGAKDDAYMFTDEEDEIAAISEPKEKISEEVPYLLSPENNGACYLIHIHTVCLSYQPISLIIIVQIQQRLAKADGKKSVYVPGVGFAIPKEEQADLWRHVVPKKRFLGVAGEKGSVPANALLPPGTQLDPTTAAGKYHY